MCVECYVDENRKTPLLNPLDCLENHTQYICGTCGRCICIEHDPHRGLQRCNFPFKSLEIAKLYLRTADYSYENERPCLRKRVQGQKGVVKMKENFMERQSVERLQHDPSRLNGAGAASDKPPRLRSWARRLAFLREA